MKEVLTFDHEDPDNGNDYTLADGADVWITVGSKSIWIRDLSGSPDDTLSVYVGVFDKGAEADQELDSILL